MGQALASVAKSLGKLKSWYIDHYMLHWPACTPEREWMGCDKNPPKGSWQDSYRAFEKLCVCF